MRPEARGPRPERERERENVLSAFLCGDINRENNKNGVFYDTKRRRSGVGLAWALLGWVGALVAPKRMVRLRYF